MRRPPRADIGLLSPVGHRRSETQVDVAAAKARDVLVATRTRLINHVRGTLKCFGDRVPSCSADSFAQKIRALIPGALRAALDPVYLALEPTRYSSKSTSGQSNSR